MVFLKSMRQSGANFRCLVPIHGKGWIGYDGMGFKGYLHKESRCVLSSNNLVCSFDNGYDTGLRYVTSAGSYQIDGMMYEFVNEEKNGGMKLYGNILAYGYHNSDDDESDKFDEPAEIIFNGMNIAAWLLENAHNLLSSSLHYYEPPTKHRPT